MARSWTLCLLTLLPLATLSLCAEFQYPTLRKGLLLVDDNDSPLSPWNRDLVENATTVDPGTAEGNVTQSTLLHRSPLTTSSPSIAPENPSLSANSDSEVSHSLSKTSTESSAGSSHNSTQVSASESILRGSPNETNGSVVVSTEAQGEESVGTPLGPVMAPPVHDAHANAETQIRSSTTLFIDGSMLNSAGVPLEKPTPSNSTSTTTMGPEKNLESSSQVDSSALRISSQTDATSTTLAPGSVASSTQATPPSTEMTQKASLATLKPSNESTVQHRSISEPVLTTTAVPTITQGPVIPETLSPSSTAPTVIAQIMTPASTASVRAPSTTAKAPVTPSESALNRSKEPTSPSTLSTGATKVDVRVSDPNSSTTTSTPSTPVSLVLESVVPDPSQAQAPTPASNSSHSHVRDLPESHKTPKSHSRPTSGRRIQLLEVEPGLQLLETHPDSANKTLHLSSLFGDRNATLTLPLVRLEDAQWRSDFFQLSHYLITDTDKLGFFKVSLEEILSRPVHGHPTMNYHTLMSNHTNLYVSEEWLNGRGGPSNSSYAVLLISRLGSYLEIYGLLSDHLMITPIWRHSTTVIPEGATIISGSVKRGERVDQFYTDTAKAGLLHGLIDLNGDTIGRHMGFDMAVLLQQIKVHLSLAKKGSRGVNPAAEGGTGSLPPPVETLYPDLTLLVDHQSYANHGRNVDELWRYLLIYFTRVDLVFRQLRSPAIRLHLRDIFIATKPFLFQKTPPKLKFTPPPGHSRPYLNGLRAINELGVYFYAESRTFANSDLMLVITGEDLCRDSADSGWASAGSPYDSCSSATVKGQSFVGGACRADVRRHKKLNVAIVEDSGYFNGVLVAAHELGHLMGSVHDGQWPINGILGPGGRGCAGAKGFLMSSQGRSGFVPSYNQFKWSLCTAEQLKYFARLPQAVCLYEKPHY